MANESDNTARLVWFIAGAAIGASIALLYAPASGVDTRRKLKKSAEEGRAKLVDSGKEMLDRGRDIYEKGKKIADEAAEIFERGREVVQKASSAICE
ncbi:MAG: YtxH domain-containing protein [Acidobacteriota bacterium]